MTSNLLAETVAIVIPALNAGRGWASCLEAISAQSLRPYRRLVIDSASTDDTVVTARKAGFEVKEIARAEFNHGGTRQWAAEYLADCKILVFLTQDAVLATPNSLAKLVSCFDDPMVAIAYARQLPHENANAIEAHARIFNYGVSSQKKDWAARGKLGAKVFFCSNSYAAYRRSTLLQLGGFRRDLILGEDAEYAARAVMAGYTNAYCAEALAYHSHNYTLAQVFKRYFDTGVFHSRTEWLCNKYGSHSGEGLRFVRSELRYLAKCAPWQIPRALAHTFAKAFGYRLGRHEAILSEGLKRRISMTPGFWRTTQLQPVQDCSAPDRRGCEQVSKRPHV